MCIYMRRAVPCQSCLASKRAKDRASNSQSSTPFSYVRLSPSPWTFQRVCKFVTRIHLFEHDQNVVEHVVREISVCNCEQNSTKPMWCHINGVLFSWYTVEAAALSTETLFLKQQCGVHFTQVLCFKTFRCLMMMMMMMITTSATTKPFQICECSICLQTSNPNHIF